MKYHTRLRAPIWLTGGAAAFTFAAIAQAEPLTIYPPVNTIGVNFANGVEMSGGRVRLVQNGGYFVKNGQVLMNQAQMIAAVDRAKGRMPERHYTARREQPSFLARTSPGARSQATPMRETSGAGGMRQMLAGVFGKSRRA